eukprot:11668632-Ditylum_brightwellii.AAC.1
MYPRKPFEETKLASHFGAGKAEYSKLYKYIITSSANADLACDLRDTRSTTSNIITVNGVTTHWYNVKQPEPTNATSNAELMGLHKIVNTTSNIRKFSTSIGYPIGEPTTLYEDTVGTIRAIVSDRVTPTHCNHGVMFHTVLHHKKVGTFGIEYAKSDMMLADINTKPQGGPTPQKKVDRIIGTRYYPPTHSEHHRLLFNTHEVSIPQQKHSNKHRTKKSSYSADD